MALSTTTRNLIACGRVSAAAAALNFRGPTRAAAWLLHDFLWLYPTLRRNCSWHGKVATRFVTPERELCLSIDDGPDEESTPEILDLLARHQAKAVFFVIGKKVERQRALCRRIIAEGHLLGAHSHSHPAAGWWALPAPLIRSEMARSAEAILVATGIRPRWFRSPVGMCNFSVHREARRQGLRILGWSASGGDGCPTAPHLVVERIRRELSPGAIILLHEGAPLRRRILTLARLLEDLKTNSYRCVLPPDEDLI